ncbi:MAG TPA: DUF308 domain-containing protein [Gemmatimonadaceae bacterium]|nr:DUF308 domain-containing protein [Gemmatimonadaceae bacterium]
MAQPLIQSTLNRAWWGIVLRGILAIALGVFIIARPLESVAAFALLIAVWALIDGITNIVHSFDVRPFVKQWWLMLVGGIISFVFGILALYAYPVLSLAFAVIWVSWWLLLSGFVGIYIAVLQRSAHVAWGWTMALGVLSVVAGVYALVYQPATLAAIMGLIAAFGIVGGIFLLIGATRLKSAQQDVRSALGASMG